MQNYLLVCCKTICHNFFRHFLFIFRCLFDLVGCMHMLDCCLRWSSLRAAFSSADLQLSAKGIQAPRAVYGYSALDLRFTARRYSAAGAALSLTTHSHRRSLSLPPSHLDLNIRFLPCSGCSTRPVACVSFGTRLGPLQLAVENSMCI
jgi:hypothetical protein